MLKAADVANIASYIVKNNIYSSNHMLNHLTVSHIHTNGRPNVMYILIQPPKRHVRDQIRSDQIRPFHR